MALGEYKRNSDLAAMAGRAKGEVVTIHNAISATATSAAIATKGFNSILIENVITIAAKLWTVKITGCLTVDGVFADVYDGVIQMSAQTSTAKINLWKGLPPYIKIVATEDEDTGKCTVRYQLLNVANLTIN